MTRLARVWTAITEPVAWLWWRSFVRGWSAPAFTVTADPVVGGPSEQNVPVRALSAPWSASHIESHSVHPTAPETTQGDQPEETDMPTALPTASPVTVDDIPPDDPALVP